MLSGQFADEPLALRRGVRIHGKMQPPASRPGGRNESRRYVQAVQTVLAADAAEAFVAFKSTVPARLACERSIPHPVVNLRQIGNHHESESDIPLLERFTKSVQKQFVDLPRFGIPWT